MPEITTEEWLAELRRIENDQPTVDGYTTEELCAIFKRGDHATRVRIKKLLSAGIIEPIIVRRRSIMNNKVYQCPAFRLIKKGKHNAKKA